MKRLILIGVLIVVVSAVLLLGMPAIKNAKNALEAKKKASKDVISTDYDKYKENGTYKNARLVDVDISIEPMCMNIITARSNGKCDKGIDCDNMCKYKGCSSFKLEYLSSKIVDRHCHCLCYDKDKIKKALHIK